MKAPATFLTALAVTSLAAAPVVAQAPRASAPTSEADEMGGGMGTGAWVAIIGVIAVVALAIIAATDDDNDSVSP